MTIRKETPEHILLGEGAFVANYDLPNESPFGAVRGGGSFTREVELREIEYDGQLGPTKGMRRKVSAVSRLVFNSLEPIQANIKSFFAGLDIDTTNTEYDEYTANRDIEDSDYIENVAFVGKTKGGKDVVIILENALGDGNLNFAFANQDEVVPEVQFTAHYDPENPETEPFKIRYPKAGA